MRNKHSWQTPLLAGWSDNEGDLIYGVAINDKLHELHINHSTIGTIISTPHNLNEWDCDLHLQKSATWGALRNQRSPPPTIGYLVSSYLQDKGWTVKEGTQPTRLSSLSVHRLTQIFTPDYQPPGSEKAWSDRLAYLDKSIPWPHVWSSIGTFMTTPTDEKPRLS
eukprot:1742995-Pleurochrysis_carterae.AAC.2